MRLPSKTDMKRSLWATFKAIAVTAIVLAIIVFSPIWDWSGHPRPSVENFVAELLILFVVLTPVFLLTTLLKEVSDNQTF